MVGGPKPAYIIITIQQPPFNRCFTDWQTTIWCTKQTLDCVLHFQTSRVGASAEAQALPPLVRLNAEILLPTPVYDAPRRSITTHPSLSPPPTLTSVYAGSGPPMECGREGEAVVLGLGLDGATSLTWMVAD